jgi:hypothetical protein
MPLFSKRKTPARDAFRFDLPQNVRNRIVYVIANALQNDMTAFGQGIDVHRIFEEAGKKALEQYGGLHADPNHRSIDKAALDHFSNCSDEHALDFLELIFHTPPFHLLAPLVGQVNKVFQDEGIGYELSPLREIDTGEPGNLYGHPIGRRIEYEFPKVVRKDTEYLHQEVVRPCLEALGRPGLETALSEMMKAHEAYRKSQYEDAITDAASAFESTLKTICSKKGWAYNQDKDTLSRLVKACGDNDLFPPFYVPIFEAVGTVRNKLGDVHGRGPKPIYKVSKEHTDHMIQMTSAHITFVLKLAGL